MGRPGSGAARVVSSPADPGGVHGLTTAELEWTFREQITWDLINPDPDADGVLAADLPVQQEHPEVTFLVAQPGAGVSGRHADIQHEFDERGGVVPVVAESFRPYHPDYERTRAFSPQDLADVTDPAARWWADRSVEWLREWSYNVLVEDHSADPDRILATAGRFADAGYQARLVALAVPPAISRLTIIETFARAAEVTGAGPWVSAEAHDASYDATAEVVRKAETSAAISRITVEMPVGALHGAVHDVERDPFGAWRARGPRGALLDEGRRSPVEVLTEARETRFTSLERRALAERLSTTIERLESVGVAYTRLYEMGVDVQRDLRSVGFETPLTERLDAALADLRAANRALDVTFGLEPDLGASSHVARAGPGPDAAGPEMGA